MTANPFAALLGGVPRLDLEQPESHMGSAYMRADPNGYYVRYADVLAALSAAPVGVRVKPLEWEPSVIGKPWHSAKAPWGWYYAQWDEETQAWFASLEMGEVEAPIILDPSDVPTIEAAQAAAQQDYEARIMAALTPAPDDAPAEDAAAKGETDGQTLERLGMDGVKWAAEFRTRALRLGYSDMDEGWLIGWFANAIMAGYDRAPTAPHVNEPQKSEHDREDVLIPAPADDVRRKALLSDAANIIRDLMAAYSKPDERICCNGRECGCHGATVQMQAEYFANEFLALIEKDTK